MSKVLELLKMVLFVALFRRFDAERRNLRVNGTIDQSNDEAVSAYG